MNKDNLNYIRIPSNVFPTIKPIIPDDRDDAAFIICMSLSKYFQNKCYSYIKAISEYLLWLRNFLILEDTSHCFLIATRWRMSSKSQQLLPCPYSK